MSALRTSLVLLGLLSVVGCTKESPPAPVAVPSAPVVAAPKAAAPEVGGGLVGTVAERLDAPNYTYLRISGPAGDTWAAVPTTTVAVGARVAILNPMAMKNFESKTLGRTFEVVMFGNAAQELAEGEAAPAAAAPAPAVNAPAVDLANIKVEKAAGPDGRTVAEVFAQSAALKDKQAAVRGKVIKFTGGILGRNWIHLRDGSGADGTKDNDLVVTTTDTVKVNDEVTLQGVVHTDRDFGAGYAYKVLIEDAKLVP